MCNRSSKQLENSNAGDGPRKIFTLRPDLC
jgi:hypothetical protein